MNETKNRKIAGVIVTPHHIEVAKQNGIGFSALSKRIQYGFPLAEAITTPLQKRPKEGKQKEWFDEKEVRRIVGRIKYINKMGEEFPYPIPKPLQQKMQQLDLTVDEIDMVEIE